jgi:hypothetical protein
MASSKEKSSKRPAKPRRGSNGASKRRKKGAKLATGKDVVRGPDYEGTVRVPINLDDAEKKRHQITAKVTEITHLEIELKPLTNKKALLTKEAKKLATDIEQGSEERRMRLYKIKDYRTSNVQVCDAETDELLEEHTMTEEERQADIEDKSADVKPDKDDDEGADADDLDEGDGTSGDEVAP